MEDNRNVIVLSATTFLVVLAIFSWLYLLPVYLKDLGASDPQVGAVYSVFGLGFTVMQALGGVFSDRLGRKRLIVYPTYLLPLCYYIVASTHDWLVASASYFVANVLSALQMPSFMAMIHESSRRKGGAFGTFEAFIMVGIALGSLVGSLLVERFGIRWLIMATAVVCAVAAVIRQFMLNETLNHEGLSPGASRSPFSLRLFLEKRVKWLLVSAIFLFLAFSITVYGPFLTLFQKEALGFLDDVINRYFALGGFLSAAASVAGGTLSDRIGPRAVLGVSLLVHTLLLLLWALLGGVMAFFILSFSFAQFCHVAYYMLITESSGEQIRARVVGVFGTVTGTVSALGPYAAMQLKLSLGHWAPFALATAFAVMGSTSLIRSRTPRA